MKIEVKIARKPETRKERLTLDGLEPLECFVFVNCPDNLKMRTDTGYLWLDDGDHVIIEDTRSSREVLRAIPRQPLVFDIEEG